MFREIELLTRAELLFRSKPGASQRLDLPIRDTVQIIPRLFVAPREMRKAACSLWLSIHSQEIEKGCFFAKNRGERKASQGFLLVSSGEDLGPSPDSVAVSALVLVVRFTSTAHSLSTESCCMAL